MRLFLGELVTGVTTGALYALIALGFSMVYGVLKLLNFAHGDLYMVGAYIGFFVLQWFGGAAHVSIPVPLLLVIMFALAAGLVGGLGVAIERFAYRPLRNAPRIAPLITAIVRCCAPPNHWITKKPMYAPTMYRSPCAKLSSF
ncbi:MAG TPA: branched-chain amino acid ABC transporter permease, partial [Streptosporangiaceae bacterium]|nr:branched-chain amino acid ABC transporter permease [Streptosporangiaceae bacterium]